MDDLFNQFRKNLEGRPEPKFDKRDWKSLEKELGPAREKRRGALAWWFAVPFMLLLTGSNAFFFSQWKKVEQQVSHQKIMHDTVFHTQVIYTTDTIYRTRVLRERVVEYATTYVQSPRNSPSPTRSFENSPQANSIDGLKPTGINTVPTTPKAPFITQIGLPFGTIDSNRQQPNPEKTTKRLLISQTLLRLPLRPIKPVQYRQTPLRLPDMALYIPAIKHKKPLLAKLYLARPKAFQVGVSVGVAYPFADGLAFKSGYATGLNAAVDFSPNLRLWADASYLKTVYLTNRMGDDIGVPVENPPSGEYVFLQAEVPQPSLLFTAGAQYRFRSKHKLRPFVGLGIGASALLPYDVVYEFKNTTLNVEWNLDKTVDRPGLGLITNSLVLPFGVEYAISKHLNGQFQANYRYKWTEAGVQSPNMLGFQIGLNYKF